MSQKELDELTQLYEKQLEHDQKLAVAIAGLDNVILFELACAVARELRARREQNPNAEKAET